MNKLIQFAISGLSLCGALAVLPGVAEAREPGRAVPGHVERDRGHDRGHDGGRGGWERGHERGGERGHERREWRNGRWVYRYDGRR
jgi:hypothetical protein